MSDVNFFPLFFLLSFCPAFGESRVCEVLAKGLNPDANVKSAVSEEDKKALLNATAAFLSKSITIRADGSASAFHTFSGRRSVEWQKFVVFKIDNKSVSEADKLKGITKKYSVIFGCDAHRAWDTTRNLWGDWLAQSYSDFPEGVVFHLKGGTWTAESPALLKYFTPGPGPSISDEKIKPSGESTELPAGMQKLK